MPNPSEIVRNLAESDPVCGQASGAFCVICGAGAVSRETISHHASCAWRQADELVTAWDAAAIGETA